MKKPFLYALGAALYIVCIVLTVSYVGSHLEGENLLMPMTMLSLLVFSVALMGFLFLSQPILLFIEGNKKGSVKFFLQTLVFFAGFVALFSGLMFIFSKIV